MLLPGLRQMDRAVRSLERILKHLNLKDPTSMNATEGLLRPTDHDNNPPIACFPFDGCNDASAGG